MLRKYAWITLCALAIFSVPAGAQQTTTSCASTPTPAGWVTLNFFTSASACPPFVANNEKTIEEIDTLGSDASLWACNNDPLPAGWVVTDITTDSQCGSGTGNKSSIRNLNGDALNTQVAVCVPFPGLTGWTASPPATDFSKCSRSTNDIETITRTTGVDLSISASPGSQSVVVGGATNYTITINRIGGLTGNVTLSTDPLPTGVSASFSPNNTTAGTSTMTVTTSSTSPTGTFSVTAIAKDGVYVRRATVSLTIGTPPAPPCTNCATMQTNGNFVVYGPTGNVVWSTNTAGTSAVIVRVQDDGNFVVYSQVWQAGVYATPSPGPFPPQTCKIATLLHAPQFMYGGQCIASPSGQYILYVATDGNFYIYNIAIGSGTWGANTAGNPGAFLNFQPDGNLVLYNSAGTIGLWNSVTSGSGSTLLNMENDGRIILYRPVWNAGTSQGWDTTQYAHPSCDVGPGTGWTGAIGVGQCFVSPNGRYELLLGTGDSLTLYDLSVSPPAVLWQRP